MGRAGPVELDVKPQREAATSQNIIVLERACMLEGDAVRRLWSGRRACRLARTAFDRILAHLIR
jgi:hypothetical protein